MHQKNLTLTLTLTKRTINCANSKKHPWFQITLKYICWQEARSHSLQKSITSSWFLITHYLTFKPTRATRDPLPSADTRSHMPSFYFVIRFKPKSTVLHSWLQKTSHSRFAIQVNFFQTAYPISSKILPYIIQNVFRPIFNVWLTTSLYLSKLSCRATLHCQEGRELENFA